MAKEEQNQNYRDQPVYWFAVLDGARERNDFETAAEAKRELERLGVKVTFRRPQQRVTTP